MEPFDVVAREVHGRLRQLLQIEAELIVGALSPRDDAHVLRGRTEARGDRTIRTATELRMMNFDLVTGVLLSARELPAAHKWQARTSR